MTEEDTRGMPRFDSISGHQMLAVDRNDGNLEYGFGITCIYDEPD